MKQYTINARLRKDTSGTPMITDIYREQTYKALQSFPMLVEAKSKTAAKEIGETVIRDCGVLDKNAIIVTVELGW